MDQSSFSAAACHTIMVPFLGLHCNSPSLPPSLSLFVQCRVDRDGAGDVGSLRRQGWPDPGEATKEENFTVTSATTTTAALPCLAADPIQPQQLQLS